MYIENIFNNIISNFDFSYMLVINVLTYFIIKIIDILNKEKQVTTLIKRLVLIAVICCITGIYKFIGYDNNIMLLNSAILSPIFWSWIIRPILNKFNLGYKQIDDTIK